MKRADQAPASPDSDYLSEEMKCRRAVMEAALWIPDGGGEQRLGLRCAAGAGRLPQPEEHSSPPVLVSVVTLSFVQAAVRFWSRRVGLKRDLSER